jgi:hypothetical protein
MVRRRAVDPEARYPSTRDKRNRALCDKCRQHWPQDLIRVVDGIQVCPNHSLYYGSCVAQDVEDGKAGALAARLEASTPQPRFAFSPEMRGVPGVSLLTPSQLTLIRGGVTKAMIVKGVNLSAADTIAFSSAAVVEAAEGYSFSVADALGENTATLNVRAPAGGPSGEFDLIYNGDTYPRVFLVRA